MVCVMQIKIPSANVPDAIVETYNFAVGDQTCLNSLVAPIKTALS